MNDTAVDTVNKGNLWKSHTRKAFTSITTEGIIGIAAVTLAIIGLANVVPEVLMAIACIAVGVAFAFEGGAISARYSTLIELNERYAKSDSFARWGGMGTLFVTGAFAIGLGILSLIGIVPLVLVPVAAIVLGAGLIVGSYTNYRLSVREARHYEEFRSRENVVKETTHASAGIQFAVGCAAVVLGIVALNGVYVLGLSLIAMLVIGATNALSGAMLGGRMSSIFK